MKRHTCLLAAAWLLGAAALAACSGGGLPDPQKTGTAEGIGHAATATAAANAAPLPTAAEIEGVIRHGFVGLNIPYTATTVVTFRKVDPLVGVLNDCANDNAGGLPRNDPGYWPAVLGHCYTVGDATSWLYTMTGRRDFAYANQMMKRYMKAKIDQANAAGANLGAGYWDLVVTRIYTLTSSGTPIAVTPPVGETAVP
ncbi:MAG TPA: hypothetical protein VEZ14_09880 [Dehalococcoidia bacterium]|nr:hypothetical protein [Dehalococcoidia bacterium]